MNKTILIGRLTSDPIRYTQDEKATAVARYNLAVNRKYKNNGQEETDFINCVTFGRNAEFAEKYLNKGSKIAVVGRIQTGNYVNKDGIKIYTFDVVVDEQEFAESKNSRADLNNGKASGDGFMNIPDYGSDDLPFN